MILSRRDRLAINPQSERLRGALWPTRPAWLRRSQNGSSAPANPLLALVRGIRSLQVYLWLSGCQAGKMEASLWRLLT